MALPPGARFCAEHGLAIQVKSPEIARFGAFELDCRNGELRRDGTPLKLQPQPARILTILVSRGGELVTRQELVEQVWGPQTFVDFEQGLNFAIRQIRTVLEDDAEHPRFLETAPKRGYRFIARVENVEAQPPPGATPIGQVAGEGLIKKPWPQYMKWVVVGLGCALLLVIATVKYRTSTSSAGKVAAPIQSIAVLPLANLSADPSQEYFSDGLTDELITELAKTGNLRVISRTSVIGFKSTNLRVPEIGHELHVWAESYDRDVSDLLGLERDVAQDIARQIGYRISRGNQSANKIAASAHEDYLRGRYFWNKRSEAGLRKGIEYFQKAIDQEPTYALAYAGLADSYIMLANWGFTPPAEAYTKARAAALRALELDDQLAEAQTSLAYVTLLYDWNWQGAETRFRQAIALNVNYASAHQFYSILLMCSGRQIEALTEINRAKELDPLSLIVNDVVGWIQYEGRHYDQAIEQYNKTLEIDPNYAPVLLDLGSAYLRKGEYRKAIAQFEKARAVGGANGLVLSNLAQAYALSGNQTEALNILKGMQEPSAPVFVSSWDQALIYTALGEKEKALALLQKAVDDHVGWVVRLRVDPAFDTLRSEPEFQALMRRLG